MNWKKLNKAIGPLHYQMSEGDCAPITIINAMLVVSKKPLKPMLLRMIWSVSLDSTEGTGYVSSKLLSDVLQSWFDYAKTDEYEKRDPNLKSEIIEGEDVHLNRSNRIARCLNAGGVACLTTNEGGHYVLLVAQENKDYLGFDPTWQNSYSKQDHIESFKDYYGIVNFRWTRDELMEEISIENNKWVHLIYPI